MATLLRRGKKTMACLAVELVLTDKGDLGRTLKILYGEIVGGRQVCDGVAVRARYNDWVGYALVQKMFVDAAI
jgi:hypothetical protein